MHFIKRINNLNMVHHFSLVRVQVDRNCSQGYFHCCCIPYNCSCYLYTVISGHANSSIQTVSPLPPTWSTLSCIPAGLCYFNPFTQWKSVCCWKPVAGFDHNRKPLEYPSLTNVNQSGDQTENSLGCKAGDTWTWITKYVSTAVKTSQPAAQGQLPKHTHSMGLLCSTTNLCVGVCSLQYTAHNLGVHLPTTKCPAADKSADVVWLLGMTVLFYFASFDETPYSITSWKHSRSVVFPALTNHQQNKCESNPIDQKAYRNIHWPTKAASSTAVHNPFPAYCLQAALSVCQWANICI